MRAVALITCAGWDVNTHKLVDRSRPAVVGCPPVAMQVEGEDEKLNRF